MQFAKYLFKIANLHLITGEKAIPIYIIGAGAGAAGGGWEILAGGFGGRFWREVLAGGFGRGEREYAERGKIIWPRGWAVSDFLLSLWHARHNRAFAQPPNLPHRDCTGTAQGLHRAERWPAHKHNTIFLCQVFLAAYHAMNV